MLIFIDKRDELKKIIKKRLTYYTQSVSSPNNHSHNSSINFHKPKNASLVNRSMVVEKGKGQTLNLINNKILNHKSPPRILDKVNIELPTLRHNYEKT